MQFQYKGAVDCFFGGGGDSLRPKLISEQAEIGFSESDVGPMSCILHTHTQQACKLFDGGVA